MPRRALKEIEWVRPPQQARSHRTLERLLDAAEALIDEKGFEKTGVAEIARRAGSSVGAFYARFPDKDALLRCVLDRFFAQARATAEEALRPARWEGVTLRDVLRASLAFIARVFRDRARLLQSFAMLGVDSQVARYNRELTALVADRCLALMAARDEIVRHPAPQEGAHFATSVFLGFFQASALNLHDSLESQPIEQLAREAADMCLAYLRIESADNRRPIDL